MSWLNNKLKLRIREVFEPRYGRVLGDNEVRDIAVNLVSLMEKYAVHIWNYKAGQAC